MLTFDIKTALVLTTAILNLALGIFVISRNIKSVVSKSFGLMTIFVSVWSFLAFAFRASPSGDLAVMFGYLLYVAATILPPIFFGMTLTLPPETKLNRTVGFLFGFETLFVMGLTLFPRLVIDGFDFSGGEKLIHWGGFYPVYILHQMIFFVIGYGVLVYKFFNSKAEQRSQIKFLILATILPANLALLSNLVLPWFGIYYFYTWFGQVCMIFIVLFSGYAIFRYNLFNIKVVATEIFVLATIGTLLVRFFLVSGNVEKSVSGVTLVLVSIFGFWIVSSVWREVKQREELQDLTKKLETSNEKLQQLDQARADFITIASHQLRTPPTTIKWYLSAVKNGDYGKIEGELKETLLKTEAVNNSLIALIDDLLNASRIERGKMEFVFSPTDVLKLVRVTVDQLEPLAGIKALKLNFTPPQVVPPLVMADGEKVRQVVNNFIDNAIKYTTSGEITVSISTTPKEVVVEVSDSGKGFSPEAGQVLFEKYVRGQSAAIHSTGLGLGLYVAKVVMEQHKGRIWAKSEGEGKGSTFGFALPIHNDLPEHSSLNLAQTQNNP